MAVRLFVGNLPYNTTEAELREHLSAVGPPSNVYLPTDRETGKPRGFAFVEFNDNAQAQEAIRRFNNQLFKGRPITINEARAREDRPPRTGPPPRPFSPRPDPSPGVRVLASRPRAVKSLAAISGLMRRRAARAISRRPGLNRSVLPRGLCEKLTRGQFFGGEDDDAFDDEFE